MRPYLYRKKTNKFTPQKLYVGVLTLVIALFPFIWFNYFDISYPLNVGGLLFRFLYLGLAVVSIFIILRLRICLLNFGWSLLIFALLWELLCELSQPRELISVYIKGEILSLALLLVLIGAYIAIRNYTEAEKRLKQSEEKYRLIFEASPEAIVLLDRKGCFVAGNNRFKEWLGYKSNEMEGKTLSELPFLSPQSKKKALKNFSERLKGKEPGPYELEFVTRDGARRIGRLSVALIKDTNKNLLQDLVMVSDVTEQRQAEQQVKNLQELDRAKDEFLNVAAHELKTPLASIIGMSQMLQSQEKSLQKSGKEYLKVIKNESFRLNRVIKQILTVTRFETGKPKLKQENFYIGKFLKSLLPTLELLAQRNESAIDLDIKNNIQIKSDKDKIAEVVYNLVENAVKYGQEKQIITVRASKMDKNRIKIEVIDQGEGISKEMKEKIFVKFGQLENYLKRTQEGIGLGLYICKVVVKKLGGQIKAKNTPEQGANFYFTLPIKGKEKKD